MLKKIHLKNYRCFPNSEITFRDTAIIVGQNNAGKSTVIEALRIISEIALKFKHTNYNPAPPQLMLPLRTKGIRINTSLLKIDFRTIVNQYKEDEGIVAEIVAIFDNDVKIHAYLSSEVFFATIKWILDRYHKQISREKMIRTLTAEDVPSEMKQVINLLMR